MATERAPGSSSASVASQEQQPGSMTAPMGLPVQPPLPDSGREQQQQQPSHHIGTYASGYGGGQAMQPMQGGYAAPQGGGGPYAAPPPQGYSPYGGYPPPPPPPHMYSGGPQLAYGPSAAAPQPMYGGAYGAGTGGGGSPYPTQQSRSHEKTTSAAATARRKSPQRRQRSPRRTPQQQLQLQHQQVVAPVNSTEEQHVEMIRQRMSAAEESTSTVKPMRSAFHFFVDDMKENLQKAAEDEVRRSTKGDDGGQPQVDPYLLNTNLNSRLMKAWEDATQDVRDSYMVKEEDDRKRFMADDEIASRHCATLTARARSPRFGSGGSGRKGTKSDDDGDDERSFSSNISFSTSATRKEAEDEKKRTSPTTENGESPTKKSRTDNIAE